MDGIFPALLKWGGNHLTLKLTIVLRACLAHRYVPNQWREVKVIFIPKPGKSDYSDPKSFRPISLTSFMLNTLEWLCDRYLREWVLIHVPLHPNQHAYSPGKSTESALHAVVNKIEAAIKNRSMCLGTFIDIEGALDRTRFSSTGKTWRECSYDRMDKQHVEPTNHQTRDGRNTAGINGKRMPPRRSPIATTMEACGE